MMNDFDRGIARYFGMALWIESTGIVGEGTVDLRLYHDLPREETDPLKRLERQMPSHLDFMARSAKARAEYMSSIDLSKADTEDVAEQVKKWIDFHCYTVDKPQFDLDRQPITCPNVTRNRRDWATASATGANVAEARRAARQRVPRYHWVVDEQVIRDAETSQTTGTAPDLQQAEAAARAVLPKFASVSSVVEVIEASTQTDLTSAEDEATAAKSILSALPKGTEVTSCKQVSAGRKGIFGIGKTLSRYEIGTKTASTVRVQYSAPAEVAVHTAREGNGVTSHPVVGGLMGSSLACLMRANGGFDAFVSSNALNRHSGRNEVSRIITDHVTAAALASDVIAKRSRIGSLIVLLHVVQQLTVCSCLLSFK